VEPTRAHERQHGQSLQGEKFQGSAATDVCEVIGADERGVAVLKNGRRSSVSYRYAARLAVVKPAQMEIAPGDRLQLKANGSSIKKGARFRTGELVTVVRIEKTGALVVNDERGATKTLAPSQRLFVRGYAVTSYASQDKTVDTVIIAEAGNRAATNAQQWQVGISRARKSSAQRRNANSLCARNQIARSPSSLSKCPCR
jgi:hypothetical protein